MKIEIKNIERIKSKEFIKSMRDEGSLDPDDAGYWFDKGFQAGIELEMRIRQAMGLVKTSQCPIKYIDKEIVDEVEYRLRCECAEYRMD